jgi:hypothetical protein
MTRLRSVYHNDDAIIVNGLCRPLGSAADTPFTPQMTAISPIQLSRARASARLLP